MHQIALYIITQMVLQLGFGGLLTTKCVSLDNQSWRTRPTHTDVNPHELDYYPFLGSTGKFDGSCNNTEDPFCRISIPDKTENSNLKLFNMVKIINESKTFVDKPKIALIVSRHQC